MVKRGMRPVHPGEVLREGFVVPLAMSANALAKGAARARPAEPQHRARAAGITAGSSISAMIFLTAPQPLQTKRFSGAA